MWPRYHHASREIKVSLLYLPQGSVSSINVASLLMLALQTATKNISIDFLTFHLTLYSHSLPISTTDIKRTHQLRCLKSPSRFQVLSLSDGLAPIGKRFMCFTTICQRSNSLLRWLQTQYATVEGNDKRINWKSKHSSEVWENFDQVAHQLTGEAKVMCRRCGKILPHPQEKGDGTNSMKRHLGSNSCRRVTSDQSQQQGIQQSFEFAV